jgi:ketosteroid isomerase-like protein
MQMTYDTMMAFAERWIAAWNRRDVDAVLAHYADDATFVSPVAHNFVGRSVLRNKRELGDYWACRADEDHDARVHPRPRRLGRAAA